MNSSPEYPFLPKWSARLETDRFSLQNGFCHQQLATKYLPLKLPKNRQNLTNGNPSPLFIKKEVQSPRFIKSYQYFRKESKPVQFITS